MKKDIIKLIIGIILLIIGIFNIQDNKGIFILFIYFAGISIGRIGHKRK